MHKVTLVILALLTIVHTASAQSVMAPPDLKELLARIKQKREVTPQMQADFQETKNVHLLNKPILSSGKVWFDAPNKFRREVKGSSPSITVSDGQQLWIYYPKFLSAEHYSLGKRSPLDAALSTILAGLNLQNLEGNYHIAGTKLAQGYQLELTPRPPSLKRLLQQFTIRIDNQLRLQETKMLAPNHDETTTTYSNELNTPIPAQTFEFTPPKGTDITNPLGR